MEAAPLLILLLVVNFTLGLGSTLFGYTYSGGKGQLVKIDITQGTSVLQCDLHDLPELYGASSGNNYYAGKAIAAPPTQSSPPQSQSLFFYTIDAAGTITLVSLDPLSCEHNSTAITGLSSGQNLVRDIKHDSATGLLYMVFPNPFCMHGSLDSVDSSTGAVISHLTNVVDPSGLGQASGLSGKSSTYYFVAVPISENDDDITYQLNKVQLANGNTTTINLQNNNLDVGDSWSSNYTLNVLVTSTGEDIVGAVSPSSSSVADCYPSGFFSINPVSGNVSCSFGPIPHAVYPLAEMDGSAQYYYQLFTDSDSRFYLYTFDWQAKKVVYSPECEVCGSITFLAAVP